MTFTASASDRDPPPRPMPFDIGAPASTAVSSLLMQDIVSANVLSVDTAKKNQVALFANPYKEWREEALVIDQTGRLTHLYRSDDSPTGWKQETIVSVVAHVTEVVIVYRKVLQEIWAACVNASDQKLILLRLGRDKAWEDRSGTVQSLTGRWSQLYVFYGNHTPNQALYGFDPDSTTLHQLTSWQSDNNGGINWVQLETTLPSKPEEYVAGWTTFGPAGGYSGYGVTVLGRNANKITCWCVNAQDNETRQYDVATDALSLAGVWDTYSNGIGVAYVCDNGDLALSGWVRGVNAYYSQRWGGLGFATASVWQDPDTQLHVFGITNDKVLKVIHQTGGWGHVIGPEWPIWAQASTSDGKTTTAVIGLNANVGAFVMDSYPDFQPSVLVKIDGAQPSDAFRLFTQDLSTEIWSEEKIRLPSTGDPHIVTRYVCETALRNIYGIPVPDYEVVISASSRVEIFVNDISYLVSPSNSVTIRTDQNGKVSFSITADSLTPPVLYVNAVGLAQGAVILPAESIHAYLSGEGILPNQRHVLDAKTLKDAKVDGQPLVTNWLIPPEKAVSSFKDSFAAAAGKPPPKRLIDGQLQPITGFAVQGWNPDRPTYQEFLSEGALNAHLSLHLTHPNFGGIWDDAWKWGHDIWEGIKKGVIRVAEVVVDLGKRIANIAIYIGDKIVRLAQVILATFDDAAHVVEVIFQQLGAASARVVDWLKALLNFNDIWETKKVFEHLLAESPNTFALLLRHFGTKSGDWFTKQEAKSRQFFAALRAKYSGGQLAMALQQAEGGIATPAGIPLRPTDFVNNPSANWMLNRVNANPLSLPELHSQLMSETDSLWDQLMTIWNNSPAPKQFTAAVNSFFEIITGLIDFNNPKPLGQREFDALFDFLENMIGLLLTVADDVLQSVLAIIQKSIQLMGEIFWTPLPNNPINTLYQWIQKTLPGSPPPQVLTLGGLISLLAAFPTTVAYKAIAGVDAGPFPGGVMRPKPPTDGTPGALGGTGAVWLAVSVGFPQLVFTYFDVGADAEALWAPKSSFFNRTAVGISVIVSLLTMPAWQVNKDGDVIPTLGSGSAMGAQWGNWAVGAVITAVNVFTAARNGKLLRNETVKIGPADVNAGAALTCFLGLGNYISYGFETYYNPNQPLVYKIGNGLLLGSNALQALRILPPITPLTKFAHGAKLFGDFCFDIAGGIMRFIGALDYKT